MTGGGRAFLVGAGPGDPGLITSRGLELLRTCDVVLYDRLVSPDLVDEVPLQAERIFVGKSADRPSPPQAEIDALIVSHARAGKNVVRLKGGDPYVFGRGADEGQALAAAGIPFEVVPGVSSAVAVPAYAGIPVTHSGISSSVSVLTAHESAMRPDAKARWRELATGADTLVLLMGVGSIRATTRELIDAGRPVSEPCAVIEWGTTARQRVVVGTLESIADRVTEAEIKPPATTVVGNVVKLRDALGWFEARPLFGRRVVVTRARTDGNKLGGLLAAQGADVLYLPTIEILDPPTWDALDVAIKDVPAGNYDWIVFSSAHGVEKFFERLRRAVFDARDLRVKVAAVGAGTAAALVSKGIHADLVPPTFTGEALVSALGPGPGSVLLPRPVDAPRAIMDRLEAAGWTVHAVPAYETVPAGLGGPTGDDVRAGAFDAITFASASSVRNFVAAAGDLTPLAAAKVVCIGPTTAAAATELGVRVDAVADVQTLDGLVRAVISCMGR